MAFTQDAPSDSRTVTLDKADWDWIKGAVTLWRMRADRDHDTAESLTASRILAELHLQAPPFTEGSGT